MATAKPVEPRRFLNSDRIKSAELTQIKRFGKNLSGEISDTNKSVMPVIEYLGNLNSELDDPLIIGIARAKPLKISEINGINLGKWGFSQSKNALIPRIAATTTAVEIFANRSVALKRDQNVTERSMGTLSFSCANRRNANAIGLLNAHESTT